MNIRTYRICSQTTFWRQVITILWTIEILFSLQFISCSNYSCFSDDKNRLLCWCYLCLFWLKQDALQNPVLIHMIQNKGRVKQSLLSGRIMGKWRRKQTSKKGVIPRPSSLFRAFPRVCKLQWVEHYTAVVSVPQFVKYILIEERYMCHDKTISPRGSQRLILACPCDKHKIALRSSAPLSVCQRRS